MRRMQFLISMYLVLAICCSTSGFSLDLEPRFEQDDDPYEILKDLKLDPAILDAIKVHPGDQLLRRLQRDRCFERAVLLAKYHILMGINRYYLPDLPEHIKLLATFPENLLELLDKPADRAKCHELRLKSFKELEEYVGKKIADDKAPSEALNTIKAARLTAEIEYLKFKEQLEKFKK